MLPSTWFPGQSHSSGFPSTPLDFLSQGSLLFPPHFLHLKTSNPLVIFMICHFSFLIYWNTNSTNFTHISLSLPSVYMGRLRHMKSSKFKVERHLVCPPGCLLFMPPLISVDGSLAFWLFQIKTLQSFLILFLLYPTSMETFPMPASLDLWGDCIPMALSLSWKYSQSKITLYMMFPGERDLWSP